MGAKKLMVERVKRSDDEGFYTPKIHSAKIRELYRIKEETGIPMTTLVDTAIAEFIEKYEVAKQEGDPKVTWAAKFVSIDDLLRGEDWRP